MKDAMSFEDRLRLYALEVPAGLQGLRLKQMRALEKLRQRYDKGLIGGPNDGSE